VKSQSRMILIDADDMIYASIQDGSITIFSRDTEGVSNYRTVDELMEMLDPGVFWRPHRSYLININHIKEVVPWFKSSFMLKMNDKRASEIPVSRAQTKRLRELLKLSGVVSGIVRGRPNVLSTYDKLRNSQTRVCGSRRPM
jgi:two-component system response regulator LytT